MGKDIWLKVAHEASFSRIMLEFKQILFVFFFKIIADYFTFFLSWSWEVAQFFLFGADFKHSFAYYPAHMSPERYLVFLNSYSEAAYYSIHNILLELL